MTKEQLELLLEYIDCRISQQEAERAERRWDESHYKTYADRARKELFNTVKEQP